MEQNTYIRYFHTIKHLKFKQIAYRLFYACTKPSLRRAPAPGRRAWSRRWSAPLVLPSALSDTGQFTFLNETGEVLSVKSWTDPERSKFWLYHLHYFDAMNAVGGDAKVALIEPLVERWIGDNPPLKGIGWEPYPVSLRLVNWIKWFSRYPDKVQPSWLDSLALQAQALTKRVEHHVLANHLFANAKALVFAGAYFEGVIANQWLAKGLRILDSELEEQFLSDGGHFERSPMYHAILLWDLCDLYNLALCSALPELKSRQTDWNKVIQQGLVWLEAMIHPDGGFAFFNDTTLGIAPTFQDIACYVESLGLKHTSETAASSVDTVNPSKRQVIQLEQSGYIIVSDADMKAILDVGHIGPDYQPGHAHADTLSFELSLFNQRVIVNSGISEYEEGEVRTYQRGTQAHNTVCVDGKNSSDVWAGFRVSKRAYPFDLTISDQIDCLTIGCSHDGYCSHPGKNIHRRTWFFEKDFVLVQDALSGQFNEALSSFYLHPLVKVKSISPQAISCILPNNRELLISVLGEGELKLAPSTWHSNFGENQPNSCVQAYFKGKELVVRIGW